MKALFIPMGLIAAVSLGVMVTPAQADDKDQDWFALADTLTHDSAPAPAEEIPQKPISWLALGVEYCLVSDSMWRGVNLSEYPGEGREKLNHQLMVSFEMDLAEMGCPIGGALGGFVWFGWYAAQEKLTPHSGSNLQEVDYSLYYSHAIGDTGLTGTLGWIALHLPTAT